MKLLLIAAVFGCVAAYAFADEAVCGPLQKVKVKRQWDRAFGEGKHRLEFGVKVWNNFFKAFPKARDLFKAYRGDNVYSPEFQAMSQRPLAALGMLIDTSDDVEALKVMVAYYKTFHAEHGVKSEYFVAFKDELLNVLPEFVGPHFDFDAWSVCLTAVTAGLQ